MLNLNGKCKIIALLLSNRNTHGITRIIVITVMIECVEIEQISICLGQILNICPSVYTMLRFIKVDHLHEKPLA